MDILIAVAIVVLLGLALKFFRPSLGSLFFRRIRFWPVILIAGSLMLFWITISAPGDPVDIIAGQHASEEVRELVRNEYGFNRPWVEQYADYYSGFFRCEWGTSYRFRGESVCELVVEHAKVSGPIGLATAMFIPIGIALGIYMAWRKGSWLETVFFVNTQLYIVVPSLITIQFIILFFSVKLGWLPAGWQGGWEGIFSKSAIIPVATLAIGSIAGMAHFVRTIAINVVDEQYITAAKAKGLSTFQILRKYVLGNVRSPVITVLAPVAFTFFEGSFFVETIYGIPGLARFMIDSVFGRDYPVILTVGFLSILTALVVNLTQDVLYHLDPRVNLTE
ncbi:MAG: ABC transporter permease [Candidatus Spechtbacterales bacterium]|nr:ABC transporter permease [Candidatus Spechtbacterales bacterium]